MFKPQITLSFGKARKKDDVITEEKTISDHIEHAKKATIDVAKMLVLGGVTIISSYVLLTAGQQILVHYATKENQQEPEQD